MFANHRWGVTYLRWNLTYDVLNNELSGHNLPAAWGKAYDPIASLAAWPSRQAIDKEIEDVC